MLVRKIGFWFPLGIILILILSASVCPEASKLPALKYTKKFILSQVAAGKEVDLNNRQITAEFLKCLLTRECKDLKIDIHRHGVNIKNATIIGPLDLKLADIPYEVSL